MSAWCVVAVVGFLAAAGRKQYVLRAEEAELRLADAERAREEHARAAALAERANAAREIHDILAHSLGALVLQLDALDAVLDGETPDHGRAVELLARARALAVEGLNEARQAVGTLRTDAPPLIDALRQLVSAACARAQLGDQRNAEAGSAEGRGRAAAHRPGGIDQCRQARARGGDDGAARLSAGRGRPDGDRHRLRRTPCAGVAGPHRWRLRDRGATGTGGVDRRDADGRPTRGRVAGHAPRARRPAPPPTGNAVSNDAPPLRIVVADDQRAVREALATVLDAEPGLEVVGLAADGDEAVELAHRFSPDVVLMDLRMPNVDGVTATRRLATELPDVKVVVLTTFADDASILAALEAGARASSPRTPDASRSPWRSARPRPARQFSTRSSRPASCGRHRRRVRCSPASASPRRCPTT